MNRKHVLTASNVLFQKALSSFKDFGEGSPEISDIKSFTASKERLHKFRNRFGLKNIKIIGETERGHIHITFIAVYSYNYSILLLLLISYYA